MTETLETREQLHKFLQSFHILVIGMITKPPFSENVSALLHSSRLAGILEGRVTEHFEQKNIITADTVNSMLLQMQRGSVASLTEDSIRHLRTFFAHSSDFIAQAFDIAAHDKPLPPLPDTMIEGKKNTRI